MSRFQVVAQFSGGFTDVQQAVGGQVYLVDVCGKIIPRLVRQTPLQMPVEQQDQFQQFKVALRHPLEHAHHVGFGSLENAGMHGTPGDEIDWRAQPVLQAKLQACKFEQSHWV